MEKSPECITSFLPSFFSSNEIDVSDILLEISSLIWRERLYTLRWAAKRRRSVLKESPFHYSLPIPSPSLPSLLQDESEFERKLQELLKDEAAAAAAAATTSPTSPLSFSPSQCDERKPELKLTFKKQKSNQKKKHRLKENIDKLTHNSGHHLGILDDLRNLYRGLMIINTKWKIKRHKGITLEQPKLEIEDGLSLTLGMTQVQHFDTPVFTNQQSQQIKNVLDDNFEDPYRQTLLFLPSSDGLGRFSNTGNNTGGSHSLFDPNVLSKQNIEMFTFQPFGMIRVIENRKIKAANARRNRISIIKQKKKIGKIVITC